MDGILVLNKPKGMTSFSCCNKLKHYFKEKTGHTGTLDEEVDGVLVITIGKATKLTELLMDHKKKYEAKCLLGIKTDTLDIHGDVLERQKVNSPLNIDEALESFKGEYLQIPPMYSAIKKDGKRLYELARKGIEVQRDPRLMNIYDIKRTSEIIYKNDTCSFDFTVIGSRGLYIRSLCEDIAKKLNTIGIMANLRRTMVGKYHLDDSYTLDEVLNGNYKIISLEEILSDFPKLYVKDYLIRLIKNGITLDERQITTTKPFVCYDSNGNMLALYQMVEENKYKPIIIL